MSESSRVPFWASRYVAGTQPCSSEVLTNHQPVEGTGENRAMRTQQDGRGGGGLDRARQPRCLASGWPTSSLKEPMPG